MNLTDPTTLAPIFFAALFIVTALTQLLKPYFPAAHTPLLAMGISILLVELLGNLQQLSGSTPFTPWAALILYLLIQGVLLGLAANGLYAGGKHIITTASSAGSTDAAPAPSK